VILCVTPLSRSCLTRVNFLYLTPLLPDTKLKPLNPLFPDTNLTPLKPLTPLLPERT